MGCEAYFKAVGGLKRFAAVQPAEALRPDERLGRGRRRLDGCLKSCREGADMSLDALDASWRRREYSPSAGVKPACPL